LFIFESFVIFDHQKEAMTLVVENTYSQRAEGELDSQLAILERELQTPTKEEQTTLLPEKLAFTSHFTQEAFEEVVNKAKEYITHGDLFQVVPSQRLSGVFKQNPFDYYRKLRLSNPSAYLYY